MTLLAVLDAALLLGLTLRLTRLATSDTITDWYLRGPLEAWADRREPNAPGWRVRLVSGLSCPFCVGFWLGCGALLWLMLAGGPGAEGTAVVVWRLVAAALTLNYVAGHVSARLD